MSRRSLGPTVMVAMMLIVGAIYFVLLSQSVMAQERPTCAVWSEPVLVFDGDSWTQYTALAAAPDNTVYGVWTNNVFGDPDAGEGQVGTDDFALFLAVMPETEGVVEANDIVARATYPRILFDAAGNMHLFRSAQCLAHSTVSESEALSGMSWFKATNICVDLTRSTFGVAASVSGGIGVAWSDDTAQVVRYASSQDGGNQWGDPIVVASARSAGEYITDVQLAIGDDDKIHVVWTYRCAESSTCFSIGYSRSDDEGKTWSEPLFLATSKSVQPSIAVSGQQIHVVWNSTVDVSKRFHRYSVDNGLSWSSTFIVSDGPTGGILGAPGLAIDSAGTVHTIIATDSAILYSCWNGQRWSTPLSLRQSVGDVGSPSLIVTNGNRLSALWHEGVRKIWYASAQADAAPVVTSLPPSRINENGSTIFTQMTPIMTQTPAPHVTSILDIVDTERLFVENDREQPRTPQPLRAVLATGVLPAIFVVGFAVLFILRARRH